MLDVKKQKEFFELSGVKDSYIDEVMNCLKNRNDIEDCHYKGEHREKRERHLSMMMLNKYLGILNENGEAEKLLSYWKGLDSINKHIRGDFHVHTNYSDGMGTVHDFVKEAEKEGYSWLGFADHSPVKGNMYRLTDDKFYKRHEEIMKAEEISGIRIYESLEADILPEGDFVCPDKWRKHLDYIIISLHEKIENYHMAVKRIEKAAASPGVLVFAHPFSGLEKDFDKGYMNDVLDILEQTETAVEFNMASRYIPFNFILADMCRERNVLKVFSTDAHFIGNIRHMKFSSLFFEDIEHENFLNIFSDPEKYFNY